jgi:hypothetical protein
VKLAGRYRRWQVSSLTGRVAGTNTYATTSTQVTYRTSQYHDGYDKHTRASTSVHNTLLLVDAGGQQHSFILTDFGLEVFNGQVVSICWAVRGRKRTIISVLNHSTRRQFVRRRNLDKVLVPRVPLFTTWLLVSLVFSVIGLIPFGMVVTLFPVCIYSAMYRRQGRRFERSGITSLWTNTAMAAAVLTGP